MPLVLRNSQKLFKLQTGFQGPVPSGVLPEEVGGSSLSPSPLTESLSATCLVRSEASSSFRGLRPSPIPFLRSLPPPAATLVPVLCLTYAECAHAWPFPGSCPDSYGVLFLPFLQAPPSGLL